jgi:hypothetical protein
VAPGSPRIDPVALGTDIDTETLLDQGQVLVELAIERTGVIVVVKGQDDMRQIGGAGGNGMSHWLLRSSLHSSTSLFSAIRLLADALRDSHI